jgi:hypothetical protein
MSHLVAILATPPRTTSGARSAARVHLAARIIGASSVTIVNLLDVPTDDVNAVSEAGRDVSHWLRTRGYLKEHLVMADDVLLAWGVSEPTGPARYFRRDQISWVHTEIRMLGATSWMVGGLPRHPSRWQRHTSRDFPGRSFPSALRASLKGTSTQ